MSHGVLPGLFRFIAVVCFLGIVTPAHATEGVPNALVEGDSHDFGSVFEGTAVIHDFIVKNTGDADLKIKNVYTG